MNALTPADAGASLVTAATDITGLTSDRGIGVDRQIVGKPAMSEAGKKAHRAEMIERSDAIRRQMAENGWGPLAIYDYNTTVERVTDPGKQPVGAGWEQKARRNPPFVTTHTAKWGELTTGAICARFRAFDNDVNDPVKAAQVDEVIERHLDPTIKRFRNNSPHSTRWYRAAEGSPGKVTFLGANGDKVEVLGDGQQSVVWGVHPSGVWLQWENDRAPWNTKVSELPAITEEQIEAMRAEIAAIIGTPEGKAGAAAGKASSNQAAPGKGNADPPPDDETFCAVTDNAENDTDHDGFKNRLLAGVGSIKAAEKRGDPPEAIEGMENSLRNWSRRGAYEPEDDATITRMLEKDNGLSGWNSYRDLSAPDCDPKIMREADLATARWWFASVKDEDDLGPETDEEIAAMTVDEERENFLSLFSAEAWEELEIAEPDRLLDDVITNGSRTFIAGKTGLGKTHLVHGIAAGVASGTGLLHWKSSRPARVLVIDGEMSKRALKPRISEAMRRLPKGVTVPRGNLIVVDQDRAIALRGKSPSLPPFAPLNTEAGHKWTLAVLKLVGKVDVVILDNVMSLTVGDQKDEQVWTDTIPLVQRLSNMGVAQIWIDHTGHSNTDRMYGSATKAWRFDSVLMLTEPKGKKDPQVTRFDLQFIKARNRAPDNWAQFQPMSVQLDKAGWTYTPATEAAKVEGLKPYLAVLYEAFEAVLSQHGGTTVNRSDWMAECVERELIPAGKENQFRTRIGELKKAGWIATDRTNAQRGPKSPYFLLEGPLPDDVDPADLID